MLSDRASDELDELLYPFYQECEGEPLEAVRPDDLLPSWALYLAIIAMCAVFGCLCALIVRL